MQTEDSGSASTAPQWRQIAGAIEAEIAQGRYASAHPLPSLLSFAQRFAVNRHTVRQALHSLQARGLISLERGRGTFVVERSIDYRLGRQVRFRGNLAGSGLEAESELLSLAAAPLPGEVAARLDLAADLPGWTLTTRSLAGRQPLSLARHWLGVNRFPALDQRVEEAGVSMTALFESYGLGGYVRLSTRIEARQPLAEEARLLALPPGVPVLVSEGLDGLPGGEPLHLVISAFAAHRVRFVVEPEAAVSPEIAGP